MKLFRCPNCHNVREKETNMILVMCGCGEEMIEEKPEVKKKCQ